MFVTNQNTKNKNSVEASGFLKKQKKEKKKENTKQNKTNNIRVHHTKEGSRTITFDTRKFWIRNQQPNDQDISKYLYILPILKIFRKSSSSHRWKMIHYSTIVDVIIS